MTEQVNLHLPEREGTNQPMALDELDSLLQILPPVQPAQHELSQDPSELDALLRDLDGAIDTTVQEIRSWDIDKKRAEAKKSPGDAFTLKVLADDPDPIIKTLALCNPNAPSSALQRAGRVESPWFQMIAAQNPSTPPSVLEDLSSSEHMDVLRGVDANPSTSPVTKLKLEEIITSGRNQSGEDDDYDDD